MKCEFYNLLIKIFIEYDFWNLLVNIFIAVGTCGATLTFPPNMCQSKVSKINLLGC